MEKRFGTFNGVFLPTFLTIIGVIYFLRLSWVVGSAGLVGTLAIIGIAHIITIATAFSMASITTNMKVKGGGAYYLISRSLGLEIGGSIGITLYLSQAISVALYIIGFIESVKLIFPKLFIIGVENPILFGGMDRNTVIISLIVAFIIGIISIVGADLAMKAQYVIFGIILLALISIVIPFNFDIDTKVIGEFKESKKFWTTFAIFFPAVTGILAGVSMSGDLKDPKKSIVKGTFIAIAVTFVIYVLQTIWFSLKFDSKELLSDSIILITKTKFSIFIIGGIWAATLSSALGSIVAAPRTMQALAKDRVLPEILGRGSGKANEPRIATILTFIIALFFIMMGKLDMVAPVITMFFLNTYGAVNLVSGIETFVGNPSYRPTFKTPWYVSIVGAFGSYGVMFLINKWATLASLFVTFVIYILLRKRKIESTWGDVRSGVWMSIARYALLNLRFQESDGHKNWKPDILVFSGSPRQRERMVYLANLLVKGNGVVTLFTYILGDIKNKMKSREIVMQNSYKFLKKKNILAFSEVVISKNFKEAALTSIQVNGIGNLKPNTVLLGFSETPENYVDYVNYIGDLITFRKNILILKYNKEKQFGKKEQIDIWWGGMQNNGKLMLLLAHIISLNDDWRGVKIRIMSIIRDQKNSEDRKDKMNKMLEAARIKAEVRLVDLREYENIQTVFKENSKNADLVILGLANPIVGMEMEYMKRIKELTENLPTTLLIKSINVENIF